MKKEIVIGMVLMLVFVGLLSGCIGTTADETSHSKIGVVVDAEHRLGGGGQHVSSTIVFADDDIITFHRLGERGPYELYLFCKSHIGDKIRIDYVHVSGFNENRINDFYKLA